MSKKGISLQDYFATRTPSGQDAESIGLALARVQVHTTARLSRPQCRIRTKSVDWAKHNSKKLLQEAKEKRERVRSRLDFVNQSITELHTNAVTTRTTKGSQTDRSRQRSNSKLETCEDETHKEAGERHLVLLRRLQREKQQRQQKLLRDLTEAEARRAAIDQEDRKKEEACRVQHKEIVLRELKQRHDLIEERKIQRAKMKTETDRKLREIKQAKPLFWALEAKFRTRVLLPELEKQASVLSRHKESVSLDSLRRRSEEIRKRETESELKRSIAKEERNRNLQRFQKELKGYYHPKAADLIAHEEAVKRENAVKQEYARKDKWMRQHQYGQLVRDLFQPHVSRIKQLELQLSREKLLAPKPPTQPKPSSQPRFQRKLRPKTKSDRSLSAASEPSPVKSVNYLEEMKNRRRTRSKGGRSFAGKYEKLLEDAESPQKLPQVQAELHRLENWARVQETMLDQLDWSQGVQAREDVSSLYIDSIRTKLALLSHLS
jgi:hypothetical protein